MLFNNCKPPLSSLTASPRCTLRGLALAAAMLLPMLPFGGEAFAAAPATITLGGEPDSNDYGGKWSILILTEAFKRMGIPLQINGFPMARRTAQVDAGELDGDVGRAFGFAAAHPNLVRIEESWSDMQFALYTSNAGLNLKSLEDLKSSDLAVEYRRGVLFCENKLKALQLKRLSDITSEVQAIKKLAAGRIDVYCDLETPVRQVLNSPELKDDKTIRKVLGLGSVSIHTYLHKKHADLVPKLAETLKKMKAEGLIETYRKQVEADLKMTR